MTITKSHIIQTLRDQNGYSKARAEELYDAVIEQMKSTLASGEDVMISGFGKFCVKNKNQRKGRNPSTGEDMILSSRKVITFSTSELLRDRVNRR